MEKLINLLNKEVANFGVLYTKLHNYHWFVKGKQFYRLHEVFEELYDEVTEHFDEVAERILMLGGKPVASLKAFLEVASVKEATGNETNEEMIQTIVNDFALIIKEFGEIIKIADDVTVDLLLGIQASLEKHVWMLKTTLM